MTSRFVVIDGNEVPFRPGEYEVVSGLSEGEEIAVTRIRRLREGERVVLSGSGRS